MGFKLLASTKFNITCLDINMMVNFKPGEYMRMMFIQSVTQVARKKIRVLPTGGHRFDSCWENSDFFLSEPPVSLTE